MIGAKSAMEAPLRRIQDLETGIKRMRSLVGEQSRLIGDGTLLRTHYYGESQHNAGAYQSGEAKLVSASSLKDQANMIASALLD